jgi:hypothetical protein
LVETGACFSFEKIEDWNWPPPPILWDGVKSCKIQQFTNQMIKE